MATRWLLVVVVLMAFVRLCQQLQLHETSSSTAPSSNSYDMSSISDFEWSTDISVDSPTSISTSYISITTQNVNNVSPTSYILPTSSSNTMIPPTGSSNISPTSTSNVSPTGSSNISPTGTSNVSPTGSSNISPTSTSNVSSTGSSNISPTGTSNVSPTGSSNTSPTSTSNVSPTGSSNISPTSTSNVSSTGSSNISPTGTSNVSPTGSSKISPTSTSNVSPTGSSKISPTSTSNVSSTGSSNISPTGTSNVSPTGSSKISPTSTSNVSSTGSSNTSPTGTSNVSPTGSSYISPTSTSNVSSTMTWPWSNPFQTPILPNIPKCPRQTDPMWDLVWPKTNAGLVAFVPCPNQFQGFARRLCSLNGSWKMPNLMQCVGESVEGIKNQAYNFFRKQPDVDGALYLVSQLSNLSRPDRKERIPASELKDMNYVIKETIKLLMNGAARGGNQGSDIVDVLNNMLDVQNAVEWTDIQEYELGSEELLSNAEEYARYLALTVNSTNETTIYSRENLAIRAERLLLKDGVFSNSTFPLSDDLMNISSNITLENQIIIPPEYLNALADDGEVSVVHMLFPSLQEILPTVDNESNPASIIISTQVISSQNESFNSTANSILTEFPINMIFSLDVTYNASFEQITSKCVYWNFSDNNDTFGGWASDNLVTVDENNGTIVHCQSYHLTSFAVLVTVVEKDMNSTSDIESQFLTVISYIGCSISIICLLATLICLLTLKKDLIKKPIYFIHFNLAFALLIALILFVAAVETAASIPGLCKAVAVLMHYFFLSAFTWMLCEGILLYLLIVIVFTRLANKWWIYMILGWGLPILPVVITFGARFDVYTPDNLCWLNTQYGVIWGFVGPIIGVICINTAILFIVLIKIARTVHLKKRRNTIRNKSFNVDQKANKHHKTALDIVKNIIILLPLLGSTWIIGIFAVNEHTTVFEWIFVILNSLQGALIFFLHIFRGPLIWKRIKKWYKKHKATKTQLTKSSQSHSTVTSIIDDTKVEATKL